MVYLQAIRNIILRKKDIRAYLGPKGKKTSLCDVKLSTRRTSTVGIINMYIPYSLEIKPTSTISRPRTQKPYCAVVYTAVPEFYNVIVTYNLKGTDNH